MSKDTKKDRHPIRFLIRILILAGMAGLVTKVIGAKKREYYGLTESQARQKFAEKLGPKIGDEKASEVADQVIPRLMHRGVVVADPESPADLNGRDDLKAGGGSDTDSDG